MRAAKSKRAKPRILCRPGAEGRRRRFVIMTEPFVEMLRGDTNTLGRTEEVVEMVFADPERAEEVYQLFHQPDEWVRMRAASVSKRLWRGDPQLFEPFIERWFAHVSALDQASTRWTFAQMCDECDDLLSNEQRQQAIDILRGYLTATDDWIVLNSSMPPLARWASDRPDLATAIRPDLDRLASDTRKSVAKRAQMALETLNG